MTDGQWIWGELDKGRVLTNRIIFLERGCMNGKGRIADLRKAGRSIVTTMVPGRRASGEKCRFAEYRKGGGMISEIILLTTFVQRVGEAINTNQPAAYLDGMADLFNALTRRIEDDLGLSE